MTSEPENARLPRASAGTPRARKIAAFALALLSDALSVFAEAVPPLEWVLDGATALALVFVLGPRWPLFLAMVVEAIPGLAAFPSWTLAVGALVTSAGREARRP